VRVASKLKLTIGQANGLRSFIEKTNDKREYSRAVAVLQKADGKTYDYIARDHRVHIRTTKQWVHNYIKKGIEGLKTRENHGGRKPRITDENKEIILSVLFNDPHLFGYLRNRWSLRSLAMCVTNELDIPISFKHLQRITRKLGIIFKRPNSNCHMERIMEKAKRE
jgi:transposase